MACNELKRATAIGRDRVTWYVTRFDAEWPIYLIR